MTGHADVVRASKSIEDQITFALKQAELELTVETVVGKTETSEATFYDWRRKHSSVEPSEPRRLRQVKQENRQLQPVIADARECLAIDFEQSLKRDRVGICRGGAAMSLGGVVSHECRVAAHEGVVCAAPPPPAVPQSGRL